MKTVAEVMAEQAAKRQKFAQERADWAAALLVQAEACTAEPKDIESRLIMRERLREYQPTMYEDMWPSDIACDHCGVELVRCGWTILVDPPKYRHVCPGCGADHYLESSLSIG